MYEHFYDFFLNFINTLYNKSSNYYVVDFLGYNQ